MLMDKKLLYESPTTDVFTVQTEGVICQSGDYVFGNPGQPGGGFGDGGSFNL